MALYSSYKSRRKNCISEERIMILFSTRMKIAQLFIEWCKENKVRKSFDSLVAFMQINEWLNEDKICEDLKE